MEIKNFISVWIKYGDIFNILYTMEGCDSYDVESDDLEQYRTSCCTTTDVLGNLLTNKISYYDIEFYHGDVITDYLGEIINNIIYPSLLIITLNDIVEGGSHYMAVIALDNGCYLIQSSKYRYTNIINFYPSLYVILQILSSLLDETNKDKKIRIYNILTHNNITTKEYNILENPIWGRNQLIAIKIYDLNIITMKQLKKRVINYIQTIPLLVYNKIETKLKEFLIL